MGLRPNGGLISSELLIECIPDMGAEEEIWIHSATTIKHCNVFGYLFVNDHTAFCLLE